MTDKTQEIKESYYKTITDNVEELREYASRSVGDELAGKIFQRVTNAVDNLESDLATDLFDGDVDEQFLHGVCVAAGMAHADEHCNEGFKKDMRHLLRRHGLIESNGIGG